MLGMEAILCELERDDETSTGGLLPPGFRFHPTDEELITFYLASKVFNGALCPAVNIAEVDLNRCEPWELPAAAKMGEREWYFFSLRDRKYPTGLRTNRATGAGYWKATGKDREVYGGGGGAPLLGMKKTLVFYKGRAPRGEKTKWVMHEYRLDGDFSCRHTGKEEWVICRIFHKKNPQTFIQPQQNYLFPPNTSNSLPPLLEPPPPAAATMQTLNQNQNPFLNVHARDYPSELKTLIDPLNILQSSSSNTILKRPYISNQDSTFRELSNAITKQCKKEVTGVDNHFQFLSGGFAAGGGGGSINNNQENPFPFGLGGEMGLIPSTADDHSNVIDHQVMSSAFKWW